MARRTKEEAAETREKILDAATLVFSDKGVGQCSLEDIAEAAGVTRGAVYWHFKNKLDVFSALHQRAHTCITDLLTEENESSSRDPLKTLEDICIENLTDLFNNDLTRRLYSIFILKCDYSGDAAQFLDEQNQRKCDNMPIVAKLFERAIANGQITKDFDPDLLSLSLCSYISGIYGDYLRNPTAFDLEKQVIPMVRIYFTGLRCTGSKTA